MSNGYLDLYLYLVAFNQIYHWQIIFYLLVVNYFKRVKEAKIDVCKMKKQYVCEVSQLSDY